MPRDVREIANAILDAAERRGVAISNLALNKLLFFAHGWFLALYGRPLINSQFEAWQYGPVHPQIHKQFKRYGDCKIRSRATRIDPATGNDVAFDYSLESTELDVIERIVEFYGGMSAGKLVQISHEAGAPWDQVWSAGEQGVRPGMIISDELAYEYYKDKLARRS